MTGPQGSVAINMAFGVIGEIFLGGPTRAQPIIIDSDGVTNGPNRVGRVFTLVAGSDGHAIVGGSGALAGILANPKVYPGLGVSGDPLGASLDLPQYAKGEAVYDTTGIIVALGAAANVGDEVYYDTTSGVIGSQAAGPFTPAAGTVAIASNVATVAALTAGSPPIGAGSVLTMADGTQTTVLKVLTGTGGNGTYTVSGLADHGAQAFSYTPALPSGKKRLQGFVVVRYNPTGAGLAVIGNIN